MVKGNEMFINSLTIPDEEWASLDIAMNDNEFDLLQNEAFDEAASAERIDQLPKIEAFCSNDNENIDLEFDPILFENEINMDARKRKSCYMEFNSDSTITNSTITTSSSIMSGDIMRDSSHRITVDMDESVELSRSLPSLSPSELDQKLEQSASRLKMSMERSEMSREKIMQNGSALYQTLVFSSLNIGTSSKYSSPSSMISHSRKAVESYISQVGRNTF